MFESREQMAIDREEQAALDTEMRARPRQEDPPCFLQDEDLAEVLDPIPDLLTAPVEYLHHLELVFGELLRSKDENALPSRDQSGFRLPVIRLCRATFR